MGRNVRNYDPTPVDKFTVAPHRYRWDAGYKPEPKTYEEWKAQVPYKEGDVVYVDFGGDALKARILGCWSERDRFGDRREKYRVQTETKAGVFSKNWTYTYPGFIQRGYKKAGLAPEMPDFK